MKGKKSNSVKIGEKILNRVEEEIRRDQLSCLHSGNWGDYGDWNDCEWHDAARHHKYYRNPIAEDKIS